jgi:hypothetical protein
MQDAKEFPLFRSRLKGVIALTHDPRFIPTREKQRLTIDDVSLKEQLDRGVLIYEGVRGFSFRDWLLRQQSQFDQLVGRHTLFLPVVTISTNMLIYTCRFE